MQNYLNLEIENIIRLNNGEKGVKNSLIFQYV